MSFVSSFFCLNFPDRFEWVLCLISMLHSMILLLCLQWYCLLMWREWKRMICWWVSFVFLLSFVFTIQIELSECCVWLQCFIQWCCSCFSNFIACLHEKNGKEWIVDRCLLCVFFLLSSPPRLSSVSVAFDFNASLNDVAPVSPILLAVVKRMRMSELLMKINCVSSFVFTA